MKHEPNATANAAAVTVGVLYVACRVLVLVVPDLFLAVTRTAKLRLPLLRPTWARLP